MKLKLTRIAEFISAQGEFAPEEAAQAYSIDSRTIGPGRLFFAVKGERLDGHDFVGQALEKGAVAAVVSKALKGENLLIVDDTMVALENLGKFARKRTSAKIVGVTGSVGTTGVSWLTTSPRGAGSTPSAVTSA